MNHHSASEDEDQSALSEERNQDSEELEKDPAPEDDFREKWQRALADLENSRKRFDQEKQQLSKFSLASFIEELLPVVDNFDRATSHIPEEQRTLPWVTGIQYIQKNLADVLEKRGVKEIPVKIGEAFNPHHHEAIGTLESSDLPDEAIAEVKNKGYLLHERVLRPVMVIVNKYHLDSDSQQEDKKGV